MTEKAKDVKVKVGQVMPPIKHETYWVVTWPTNAVVKAKLGSITFSIEPGIWDGPHPKPGEFLVVQSPIEKSDGPRTGWRTQGARYFRKEDIGDPNIEQ